MTRHNLEVTENSRKSIKCKSLCYFIDHTQVLITEQYTVAWTAILTEKNLFHICCFQSPCYLTRRGGENFWQSHDVVFKLCCAINSLEKPYIFYYYYIALRKTCEIAKWFPVFSSYSFKNVLWTLVFLGLLNKQYIKISTNQILKEKVGPRNL